MTQVSDNTPPSFLADLPEELSLAMIEELDMPSIIALSQTSRQFQRLSNPADEAKRSKLHEFLLEVQYFDRWSDGFACFSCNKVIPRESFARSQTKLKRGRGAAFERQVFRYCIPCGLSKNVYVPGNQVGQGDEVRFVCRRCKEVRDGKFCRNCATCSHCDHTYVRGLSLKQCEEAGRSRGHEIVSNGAFAYVAPTLASPRLTIHRYYGRPDAEDDEGHYNSDGKRVSQEWTPEWYDGPDDD